MQHQPLHTTTLQPPNSPLSHQLCHHPRNAQQETLVPSRPHSIKHTATTRSITTTSSSTFASPRHRHPPTAASTSRRRHSCCSPKPSRCCERRVVRVVGVLCYELQCFCGLAGGCCCCGQQAHQLRQHHTGSMQELLHAIGLCV